MTSQTQVTQYITKVAEYAALNELPFETMQDIKNAMVSYQIEQRNILDKVNALPENGKKALIRQIGFEVWSRAHRIQADKITNYLLNA